MLKDKTIMRKILCIISVALLALTACTSNDDNPIKPDEPAAEAVHLTQQYSVSTLANGDTMTITSPTRAAS